MTKIPLGKNVLEEMQGGIMYSQGGAVTQNWVCDGLMRADEVALIKQRRLERKPTDTFISS